MSDHRDRPLCILGSTGSIGISTLVVAADLGIPVHTLTANTSTRKLADQAIACSARRVVIADPSREADLCDLLTAHPEIEVSSGAAALEEAAADPACGAVITAIVGGAGLPATLAAVRAGKRVCIANKEPLVMAGHLIMDTARRSGAEILPVDSEHSAIFQCLIGHRVDEVQELLLTGSGGPCRRIQDLSTVTVDQALAHPNWDMGPKITIDSATMMNKALELIEARWLFDVPVERIRVVIHPQSIVHSMVAFRDGSLLAQLGAPDMRTPIQYSLTHPVHVDGGAPCPSLTAIASLEFEDLNAQRFPAVDLAREATRRGGLAPVVLNAANEVAVAAFLAGRIPFTRIVGIVEEALRDAPMVTNPDLTTILAQDAATRRQLGST